LLADFDQESITGLPIGAMAQEYLRPILEVSNSSETIIVGRLAAKGTGAFNDSYSSK